MHKVIIVGTGPAGLTAAIYAARAGLDPVVFTGLQPGGQLTTTTEIENFPGFHEPIAGTKLMDEMSLQAQRVGAKLIQKEITHVDFSRKPFTLMCDKEKFESETVIIATGATAKTLGLPNESQLMGRGISTCATCDGFFYKGKDVIVIGGGDSAMEESLYLANLCKSVMLVHRRDVFRASNIMLARAKKHPKIQFHTPYGIEEPLFDAKRGVFGVKLKNLETGEVKDQLCDGLFYAIGHTPNAKVFLPYVDLDANGYIKVHEFTKTKTPGLFACGDICDPTFKQAITAAGMGCQAAIQAARYLEEVHS